MSLQFDLQEFDSQEFDLQELDLQKIEQDEPSGLLKLQPNHPCTIAFVDPAIEDYEALIKGVDPTVEVSVLDPDQDGVEQITRTLTDRTDVTAVHVFSHGSPGHLYLGNTQLNAETLPRYTESAWSSALAAIDLFLYGCRVAEGTVGTAFLQKLHRLSGANIAASATPTGSADHGGDWNLEVQVGEIEPETVLSLEVMRDYAGVLGTVTVTSLADSGAGSLREALAAAQSGDTIAFASSLAGGTIGLTSGQLVVSAGKNLTIDGGAAPGLTISGNNASRILLVDANVDFQTNATVKNLSLINGSTIDGGGAIFVANRGALTADNVTFNNNSSVNNGAAISTAFQVNLTILNSRFNNNNATAGNSEQGAGAIYTAGGALTVQNSDFNNNKGINGGAINTIAAALLVENSRFVGNDVLAGQFAAAGIDNNFLRGYGGAIYTDRAENTTMIRNSYFENNASRAAGGALYLFNDPEDVVTIENSSFKSNRAIGLPGGEGGSGGAIYHLRSSTGGSFTVTNAAFVDNEAHSGGGAIRLQNSPSDITNTTFASNRILSVGQDYTANGGAFIAYNSQVNLTNSTLSQNSAHWVGGGIAASSDSTVRVKNTIYDRNVSYIGGITPAANEPAIGTENLIDQGGNIQFGTIGSTPGSGVRVVDPLLGPVQQAGSLFVLPLLPGSPAIDTGVAGGPGVDERGVARDAQPDVGAVEFFSGTLPPVLPSLSISNVSLNEGNAGTTNAVFTVSLSRSSPTPISVNFATADGTAISGSDYTPLSGTLNFAPNQLTQTIQIPVIGDTVDEPNETFSVNLSAPVNASLLTAQGIATILNDDSATTPPVTTPPGGTTPPGTTPPGTNPQAPTVSISDVQVVEGTGKGSTRAVFTVSLSQPTDRRVSVSYFTANGSAVAGSDYQPVGGRLSFKPGQTTRTIEVNIGRDRLLEPDETFTVNLRDSAGAYIGKGQGTGTIVNDDTATTTGGTKLTTAIASATSFIQSVLKGKLPALTALNEINGAAGGFFTKGLTIDPSTLPISTSSIPSELSNSALSKAVLAALKK